MITDSSTPTRSPLCATLGLAFPLLVASGLPCIGCTGGVGATMASGTESSSALTTSTSTSAGTSTATTTDADTLTTGADTLTTGVDTDTETGSTTTGDELPVGHAHFILDGTDYAQTEYSWTNDDGNHVFCWYYSGAEKGDYVWVRFAESPDQNGDNSPHIDLDVCRFTSDGPGGEYSAMDPTKFGSQCPTDPGFGIWWHEGEIAYNNDPAAQECQLTIDVDGEVLRGEFHCNPLPETDGDKTLAVSEGSFSCKAVAK